MKYAAIVSRSIHHEGDERSRTNPGHGYPAYTETVTEFKEFFSEQEMKKWVLNNSIGPVRIIRYEDVKISTEVIVHAS